MTEPQRLAIIGAGAKAAAICAKVACLRVETNAPIEVTVFERHTPGANWSGAHGYSDGVQRLCTPAERDVGFPYVAKTFGAAVNTAMHANFSWLAYLVSINGYGDWVDRGRPRPPHSEFAAYLSWCIDRSGFPVVTGEVVALRPQGPLWQINYVAGGGAPQRFPDSFDGVVATGPGPSRSRIPKDNGAAVLDGETFWRSTAAVLAACEAQPGEAVVIIGSGGTAAATAAWLIRNGVENEIIILGAQPALFARAENFFENRAFRDPQVWETLNETDRLAFVDRLTRGAVWANVVEDLSASAQISYRPGKATAVTVPAPGATYVAYQASGGRTDMVEAVVVVDATGFDGQWFADLLPAPLPDLARDTLTMQRGMDPSTVLPLGIEARLHVPSLSHLLHPAYASLMALGDLSDAILEPYVTAAGP